MDTNMFALKITATGCYLYTSEILTGYRNLCFFLSSWSGLIKQLWCWKPPSEQEAEVTVHCCSNMEEGKTMKFL